MNNGILLALIAYAVYSWGDASIKALGGGLTVFEIGFFTALVASLCIIVTTPKEENWRHFWHMKRPLAVQARALIGAATSVLSIVAFTSLPFAEVYALIFLAPLFVTILSIVILKEQVGLWRWFAVAGGLFGVLLVVQPGFRTLEIGHAAAIGAALCAAIAIILMRSLSAHETRATMLGYLMLYILLVNAIGMAATTIRLPTWQQAVLLVLAGACTAAGNIWLLKATRLAPANQLASTHYSQIVWAVVIGALVFDERVGFLAIIGLVVIAASGLLTMARERIRLGTVRWNPLGRSRL